MQWVCWDEPLYALHLLIQGTWNSLEYNEDISTNFTWKNRIPVKGKAIRLQNYSFVNKNPDRSQPSKAVYAVNIHYFPTKLWWCPQSHCSLCGHFVVLQLLWCGSVQLLSWPRALQVLTSLSVRTNSITTHFRMSKRAEEQEHITNFSGYGSNSLQLTNPAASQHPVNSHTTSPEARRSGPHTLYRKTNTKLSR